ncbi:MAG: hypothetical protein AB7P02_12895 [Alphaproteobacteria bacterium]
MPRLAHPKAKGDAYEREIADYFNTHLDPRVRLGEFRRAIMSGGGFTHSGFDLTNTEVTPSGPRAGFTPQRVYLGIEAKRTERANLWESYAQALRHKAHAFRFNANHPPIVPMVIMRRNRMSTGASLVTMSLDDLIALINGYVPGGA